MTILGIDSLERLKEKHPAARRPLAKWELTVSEASWRNFVQVKSTFSTASYVKDRTIFNVGGNKYRIITIVQYKAQIVIVTEACTHEEYDRGGWK